MTTFVLWPDGAFACALRLTFNGSLPLQRLFWKGRGHCSLVIRQMVEHLQGRTEYNSRESFWMMSRSFRATCYASTPRQRLSRLTPQDHYAAPTHIIWGVQSPIAWTRSSSASWRWMFSFPCSPTPSPSRSDYLYSLRKGEPGFTAKLRASSPCSQPAVTSWLRR